MSNFNVMKRMIPTLSLEVGMYLCTNIYDGNGVLLLAKDNIIDSDTKLKRILESSNFYTFIDTERGKDLELGGRITRRAEWSLYSFSYESNELIEFADEFENVRLMYSGIYKDVDRIYKNLQSGNFFFSLDKIQSILKKFLKSIEKSKNALFVFSKIYGGGDYLISHTMNVTILSILLGRFLDYEWEEVFKIGLAGFFHDIGFIMISDEIIKKSGKLTEEEWVEVKKHPVYSAEIVRKIPEFPAASLRAVFEHHERIDGSGYPKGIVGESISRFARIVAVADVFDAMTSKKPYTDELALYEGISRLYKLEKMKSDIVNKFISLIGVYPLGTLVKLTTGEIGVVISVNHESLLRPKVGIVYDAFRVKRKSLYEYIDLSEIEKEIAIEKVLDPNLWEINVAEYLENLIPEDLFR